MIGKMIYWLFGQSSDPWSHLRRRSPLKTMIVRLGVFFGLIALVDVMAALFTHNNPLLISFGVALSYQIVEHIPIVLAAMGRSTRKLETDWFWHFIGGLVSMLGAGLITIAMLQAWNPSFLVALMFYPIFWVGMGISGHGACYHLESDPPRKRRKLRMTVKIKWPSWRPAKPLVWERSPSGI